MRPEKDSEVWTKSDEQRKRAGFEFAAEPMEVLLLFPTIYYMAGMSVLIVILSIVLWITFPLMWDYFVWSVSSTLSIGLIIFLPEYFSNIISFAIHLCYWIAFSIYIFVYIIQFAVGMSKAKNAFDEVAAGRGQSYEDSNEFRHVKTS
ncbi:Protein CBG21140 [Caenorhabditis briggsae]|uniref:Protein CBG21140 n=1 Tax=Caenorhabditis briggsae TaxID=6238 RepID=A8XZE3_CAEBR|nr:Protein CBG21140 [Caenorhabditis briggsae]CAP38070.2 Protein CBG21140 [Caenorhabditis briggsae]